MSLIIDETGNNSSSNNNSNTTTTDRKTKAIATNDKGSDTLERRGEVDIKLVTHCSDELELYICPIYCNFLYAIVVIYFLNNNTN